MIDVDEASDLTVTIRNASAIVRTIVSGDHVSAGRTSYDWNGRAQGGAIVHDGTYTVRAVAVDPSSNVGSDNAQVRVDTKAPSFSWHGVHPEPIVKPRPVHLSFRTGDASGPLRGTLDVLDADGALVRRLRGLSFAPGSRSVTWNGHDAKGKPVGPGLYRARMTLKDQAGNQVTSKLEPFRDERPTKAKVVNGFDHVGKRVALTFDDCTFERAWSKILSTLHAMHAGGSFFCTGQRVHMFPKLARKTVAMGMTIGNHTWDHKDLTKLSAPAIDSELRRTSQAWWKAARVTPAPYMRPPYGAIDRSAAQAIGRAGYSRIMLWDVDPRDWTDPGVGAIQRAVLSHTRAGDIVCMHTKPQTAAAVAGIVHGLRKRGLEPVTLDQLFALSRHA